MKVYFLRYSCYDTDYDEEEFIGVYTSKELCEEVMYRHLHMKTICHSFFNETEIVEAETPLQRYEFIENCHNTISYTFLYGIGYTITEYVVDDMNL